MTDIVERIEAADIDTMWRDAVHEIHELRAEIKRLRALLRKRCCGDAECHFEDSGLECAALKDTTP